MTIHTLLSIYIGVLGLLVGSYLNVVIYRLPRKVSTVLPRSRCPRCLFPIRPWHNIPVLGYLILGGRCRQCRVKISARYPMIEVATALCFLLAWQRYGISWQALITVGFCSAMIVLTMIDLEHYILPDVITLPGILLGLAIQPWLPWLSRGDAWIGALAGAGILYAVAWGWYFLRGIWGMGMGDVKMLAMVGAFLGWQGALVTLLLSSLGGSLAGGLLLLAGRVRMQSKLPYGAFLGPAAIVALFYGPQMLRAYLGFAGELLN